MQQSNQRSRAFTLIELIVVIGIVIVLTGIVASATISARRGSHGAGARIAAKQLVVATYLYATDHDEVLPFLHSLRKTVREDQFLDARDSWRGHDRKKTPLVGSFGYYFAPHTGVEPNPRRLSLSRDGLETIPMFINVFESESVTPFFEGETCAFIRGRSCYGPTDVACIMFDGSYTVSKRSNEEAKRTVMSWPEQMIRCFREPAE